MSVDLDFGSKAYAEDLNVRFEIANKEFDRLLPNGIGDIVIPTPPGVLTPPIYQIYNDGTVVETHFNTQGEANEIIVVGPERPPVETVYWFEEKGDGGRWMSTAPDGKLIMGLPDGQFLEETGEFRLRDKLLYSSYVAEDYPLEDDPADDTDVVSVTLTDTPPNERFAESITNYDDFETYTVTFADTTTATVLVETPAVPEGETAKGMATLHADRIALLPPEIRTELTRGLNYVRSQDALGEGAAAQVHGLPLDEPRGLSVAVPALLELSDEDFQSTMLHETGHIVDDDIINDDPVWIAAMDADGVSPSAYSDTHSREDFAESYVLWYVIRSGQIPDDEAAMLKEAFSNRFAILDDSPEAVATLPQDIN